jgi:hypothetical protein
MTEHQRALKALDTYREAVAALREWEVDLYYDLQPGEFLVVLPLRLPTSIVIPEDTCA